MDPNLPRNNFRILTDEPDENPILDSKSYSKTIGNIVVSSFPKFSIGIYGEWGTGKTTLMKLIEKEVKSEDVLAIWFNAWRYEREEHFAVVALMKTIAFAMTGHPIYENIKRIILRGLKLVGEAALEETAALIVNETTINNFKEKLLPKREFLEEVDRETIYFDGIKKIEEEMLKVRDQRPERRVVVFIDDLDRCSPDKALEVFESIKVFLDVEGFIFVLGLSHRTISKLITTLYEKSEIKGEDYIQKIIQIPVIVPEWNKADINELITNLSTRVGEKYSKILLDNRKIIANALKPNPRELKQFINNFIIANEIFSEKSNVSTELLLTVHALRTRWSEVYKLISTGKDFRERLQELAEMTPNDRENVLALILKDREKAEEVDKKIADVSRPELWEFIEVALERISKIDDWDIYRRAIESVKQKQEPIDAGRLDLEAKMLIVELEKIDKEIIDLAMKRDELERESKTARAQDAQMFAHDLQNLDIISVQLLERKKDLLQRRTALRNRIVHQY